MANYRAVANGNWSSGATWGGGAVPPNGEGHNIYSNSFTVTIDTNVDVALITNASNTGTFVGGGTAAAGGGFVVSSSVTITANVTGFGQYTTSTLTFSGGAGVSVVVNGNVNGREANTAGLAAIRQTGAGTLTINGNVTSSTVNSGYNAVGIFATAGTTIVNGNLSTADGHPNATVANGAPYAAIYCQGTNNLTVNNSTMSGGGAAGGSGTSQMAIWQNGSSTVVTLNNCIVNAGAVSPAVIVSNGAFFSNNGVITATNLASAISAGLVTAFGTFVYSTNGTNPVGGARVVLGTTPTNAYTQFALNGINSNSFVRYYTADNNLGQANPTDVRSGVSYASGNLTGRLTIPARGTVANGVTVGPNMPFTATRSGTTATATLTYSYPYSVGDVITVTGASNSEWNMDYTIASVISGTSVTFTVPATHSATAGTGANMQTKGTAVLEASAVAAAVWGAATRTLTSASGPTAVEIRQEMDTNSTKLANLDATVSSRLAPSGTLARVTLVDTATTLTNAPTVPSAATIATQVRTELGTELGRIDAAISTRATPANIPASDITAIKAKTDALNTDRLAQVSTVSTTGAQLAAALS